MTWWRLTYIGRYDYHCMRSRVTWGCVITVYGLFEAKKFCDEDSECEAFVLFSQRPETDGNFLISKAVTQWLRS